MRMLSESASLGVCCCSRFLGGARDFDRGSRPVEGALDELRQRIQPEARQLQFASMGILVMGYGMLAKHGAVSNYPVTALFPWLWMAMFVLWAGGIAWVRRKYR